MKLLLLMVAWFCLSPIVFGQRTLYTNGKIYTVNKQQPWAEAVVTEGNRIVFVGDAADAEKWNDAARVDLKGRLMLPGFIDNHTHFVSGGFYLLGIDLRQAKSTSEFKQIIKDYVAGHEGQWITGGDWDHEAWEVKSLPTKAMIDEFSKTTPIAVNRFDGHMILANSYALKLAGITKDTPSPAGGTIVKDPQTGEPTGVLKDAAMDLIYAKVPTASEAEMEKATLRALQEAREKGVTSIQDITYHNDLLTYQRLERQGQLTCRIYTRLPVTEYTNLVKTGIERGFGSDYLKLGSLKVFADGSLGSSTALFFKPYKQDPNTRGLAMDVVTSGKLQEWALDADKHHLQLSIHAIGDSANYLILKLFEDIVKKNPAWDRRFRIEHAQHVKPEHVALFKKYNVIASVQPYHAIDDGIWAEKRIGERIKYTYAFKSFLDGGVTMTFGSDWTVAPIDPLLGIYAAVTRQTLDGKNPKGWIPEQKVTVGDAIACYTINNAYAAFEEHQKGSIEVGKLADLVVLSDNILEMDPQKIKQVQVDRTVFDGKTIYLRSN